MILLRPCAAFSACVAALGRPGEARPQGAAAAPARRTRRWPEGVDLAVAGSARTLAEPAIGPSSSATGTVNWRSGNPTGARRRGRWRTCAAGSIFWRLVPCASPRWSGQHLRLAAGRPCGTGAILLSGVLTWLIAMASRVNAATRPISPISAVFSAALAMSSDSPESFPDRAPMTGMSSPTMAPAILASPDTSWAPTPTTDPMIPASRENRPAAMPRCPGQPRQQQADPGDDRGRQPTPPVELLHGHRALDEPVRQRRQPQDHPREGVHDLEQYLGQPRHVRREIQDGVTKIAENLPDLLQVRHHIRQQALRLTGLAWTAGPR